VVVQKALGNYQACKATTSYIGIFARKQCCTIVQLAEYTTDGPHINGSSVVLMSDGVKSVIAASITLVGNGVGAATLECSRSSGERYQIVTTSPLSERGRNGELKMRANPKSPKSSPMCRWWHCQAYSTLRERERESVCVCVCDTDFDHALFRTFTHDENVCRLQISMQHPIGMQVLNAI
jgi:hypothetical protein